MINENTSTSIKWLVKILILLKLDNFLFFGAHRETLATTARQKNRLQWTRSMWFAGIFFPQFHSFVSFLWFRSSINVNNSGYFNWYFFFLMLPNLFEDPIQSGSRVFCCCCFLCNFYNRFITCWLNFILITPTTLCHFHFIVKCSRLLFISFAHIRSNDW